MKKTITFIIFIMFSTTSFAGVIGQGISQTKRVVKIASVGGKATTASSAKTIQHYSAKYGSDAAPFLRQTGDLGVKALEKTGVHAPSVIKLHKKYGDEAHWLISSDARLAHIAKHGEAAGEAMIKHPGVAEKMLNAMGAESITALNKLSSTGAQRFAMAEKSGVFTATNQSKNLLSVIETYGDKAMKFIWENKLPLTYVAVLTSFLHEPETYFSGAKQLVVEPLSQSIIEPITHSVPWGIIVSVLLFFMFLPWLVKRFYSAKRAVNEAREQEANPKSE